MESRIFALLAIPLFILPASGQAKAPSYDASVPKPTLSEVAYGSHTRQTLDFWKAQSSKPTPLVFVIHGGGWQGGTKERLNRFADPNALLKAGISVVAINYRLISHALEEEGKTSGSRPAPRRRPRAAIRAKQSRRMEH